MHELTLPFNSSDKFRQLRRKPRPKTVVQLVVLFLTYTLYLSFLFDRRDYYTTLETLFNFSNRQRVAEVGGLSVLLLQSLKGYFGVSILRVLNLFYFLLLNIYDVCVRSPCRQPGVVVSLGRLVSVART